MAMCVLLLVPRLARRERKAVDMNDRGRRYDLAKRGEL
jgi:hypothetical protein